MTEQSAEPGTDTLAAANAAAVEKFLYALRDKDFDTLQTLVADDIVYENYGYTRLRGAKRLIALFRKMQRPSMGFDVKLHRNIAEGDNVLNERTDALIFGRVQMVFAVCGVFEVHDGRITLWRDYFDMFDMLKATLRGLVAVVVPSLRATL